MELQQIDYKAGDLVIITDEDYKKSSVISLGSDLPLLGSVDQVSGNIVYVALFDRAYMEKEYGDGGSIPINIQDLNPFIFQRAEPVIRISDRSAYMIDKIHIDYGKVHWDKKGVYFRLKPIIGWENGMSVNYQELMKSYEPLHVL